MTFQEIMMTYFQGEKWEAILFVIPAGLALIALGVTALRVEKGSFAWGIAIPAILFGLVCLGTGLGIGLRTNGQVKALQDEFKSNPAEMVKKELPRMQKVNANFRMTLLYALPIFVLIGLLLVVLGGADWIKGVGSVLIVAAGIGLLIDCFAYRRSHPYTEALESLAKQHNVAISEQQTK